LERKRLPNFVQNKLKIIQSVQNNQKIEVRIKRNSTDIIGYAMAQSTTYDLDVYQPCNPKASA